jgi:hypothetical protein
MISVCWPCFYWHCGTNELFYYSWGPICNLHAFGLDPVCVNVHHAIVHASTHFMCPLSTSPKASQKPQIPSIKNPKLSTSTKPSQKSQVLLINIISLCEIIWAYVQMAPTPARVNQHPPMHHPLNVRYYGWTSTELMFGFTLVTHLVRNRSYV